MGNLIQNHRAVTGAILLIIMQSLKDRDQSKDEVSSD